MEAVFGLLGILVGVSHGMVTSCDARQNRSCYAALGGTVYLQLVTDARAYEIPLKKDSNGNTIRIFRTKDNEVIIHDSITARSHFFISNGTFMINNTERTDLAEYVIVTFDKNGKSLGTRGLQLLIEVIIWMVAGSLAAVVIVLVMVLGVYCVQKKNKPSKTPANDDSQVVEYADVRILKKQMRQKETEASIEVEYGQFKTLQGPRQKVDTPDTPEEEDCVYARVQKGQEARYCLDSM
ncbi:uncharacterized protein LOC118376109 isoform X1 [Oncorhynchus keta]|uniref:uncharacterized protein LOC118376109 isoform X1 n=1 Tax=Oncorhynchus keta TaxID=8018 RepID=UPI0015F89D64|nr:uncharacterized protein LOC118376109 isoform X1 [Oncorhynchus keta]